jgi:hypothetical protein
MSHELNPIEESPHDKQFLKDAADLVRNKIPPGYGFIVFAFPVNAPGRLFYISTGQRDGCIATLKEWIRHAEAHGIDKHA